MRGRSGCRVGVQVEELDSGTFALDEMMPIIGINENMRGWTSVICGAWTLDIRWRVHF